MPLTTLAQLLVYAKERGYDVIRVKQWIDIKPSGQPHGGRGVRTVRAAVILVDKLYAVKLSKCGCKGSKEWIKSHKL